LNTSPSAKRERIGEGKKEALLFKEGRTYIVIEERERSLCQRERKEGKGLMTYTIKREKNQRKGGGSLRPFFREKKKRRGMK